MTQAVNPYGAPKTAVAAGDNLQWDCTGGTLPGKYPPTTCRPK